MSSKSRQQSTLVAPAALYIEGISHRTSDGILSKANKTILSFGMFAKLKATLSTL